MLDYPGMNKNYVLLSKKGRGDWERKKQVYKKKKGQCDQRRMRIKGDVTCQEGTGGTGQFPKQGRGKPSTMAAKKSGI